jgi:hypothetical protein
MDTIDNMKRYIKIIENNEKNSNPNPASNPNLRLKPKANQSRSRSNRIEYTRSIREEDNELFKEIKKIDASIEYSEDDVKHSNWRNERAEREASNRFIDLSLE